MHKLTQGLFLRALALIYFLAFASLTFQTKGLYSHNGITPIEISVRTFLERSSTNPYEAFIKIPSLFWFRQSDFAINSLPYIGMILALVLFTLPFIVKTKNQNYLEAFVCFVLYLSYLSYVNLGNVFMNFQWDILLLETGFWVILFCIFRNNVFANKAFTWIFRFLLFKLMFMSGLVKLTSGDPTWRDLTALSYHYYTQPIPNPLSFLAHQLPLWLHQFNCALMFLIELIVPFFIFANSRFRFIAALLFIALQIVIISTGNYCFFNLLTMALCLWLVDDKYIESYLPSKLQARFREDAIEDPQDLISHSINSRLEKLGKLRGNYIKQLIKYIAVALAIFYIGLSSLFIFANVPSNFPLQNQARLITRNFLQATHSYMLSSPYGLFAVMTSKRFEIVIQGLESEDSSWKDYEFFYKPGDPRRVPPQIAPYQPRLDWQMWFAALSNYKQNPWLVNLAVRLLEGNKEAIKLLEYNPFPTQPPKFIRAIVYEYKFNTIDGFNQSGEIWIREPKGLYLPPLSLR